jgi:hypothetical protein
VLQPVIGPTALQKPMTRLANSVDALYAIPDSPVSAREHSCALLLFSLRNLIHAVEGMCE